MQKPTMQKHIGKNRKNLIAKGKMSRHFMDSIFCRDQTIGIKNNFIVKSSLNLQKKYQDIYAHKNIGGNRKAVRWLIVSNGYHLFFFILLNCNLDFQSNSFGCYLFKKILFYNNSKRYNFNTILLF